MHPRIAAIVGEYNFRIFREAIRGAIRAQKGGEKKETNKTRGLRLTEPRG